MDPPPEELQMMLKERESLLEVAYKQGTDQELDLRRRLEKVCTLVEAR
jgi:hypothetical protein